MLFDHTLSIVVFSFTEHCGSTLLDGQFLYFYFYSYLLIMPALGTILLDIFGKVYAIGKVSLPLLMCFG